MNYIRNIIALALLMSAQIVMAQAPRTLTYQGRLSDADGPLNGAHTLRFDIYNAPSGGTTLWTETLTAVDVTNGYVSVTLGKTTPIGVDVNQPLWLGTTVDANPEVSPRVELTASLYALGVVAPLNLASNGGTTLTSVQTGLGGAARLAIENASNSGPVLTIESNGNGNAITANRPIQATKFVGDGSLLTNLPASGWSLTGNTGTEPLSQFIGTLDNKDFYIRTNGLNRVRVNAIGTVDFAGTNTSNQVTLGGTTSITGQALNAYGYGIFFSNTVNDGGITGSNSDGGTSGVGGRKGGRFYAESSGIETKYGVHAWARGNGQKYALFAQVDGSGGTSNGVYALAGATGDFATSAAVTGHASSAATQAAYGVQGYANGSGRLNYALYGSASGGTTAYGLYATATGAATNIAGHFQGDVTITGNLSKGSGTFKIDHPMDPENKFLSHSFVESPDMMNIYNGNVVTDAHGFAVVTLPAYFEALNKDFRYQLTVIGDFANAIIGKKIANNEFTIRTDKPNVEVSWQITGIRKDPYAEKNRVVPETEKLPAEKGKYLHPEAYGQPAERGINATINN